MKTMIEKINWDKIDEIDTGARARVERWRKLAEKQLAKIAPGGVDEITAMAERRGLSIVEYVVEYLKATRIDCTDEKLGLNCPRLNRTTDATFDHGSKQARTAHEKEIVTFAFNTLGVRFHDDDFTLDDMRVLAANFATPDDWNLNDAKTRAVRFALDHMDN